MVRSAHWTAAVTSDYVLGLDFELKRSSVVLFYFPRTRPPAIIMPAPPRIKTALTRRAVPATRRTSE